MKNISSIAPCHAFRQIFFTKQAQSSKALDLRPWVLTKTRSFEGGVNKSNLANVEHHD
jgi:hypothetical protein